jgi:sulfate permease, SulP family
LMLGATAFKVFSDYSESLRAAEGKLYLSGVDPALMEQFSNAGHVDATGPVEMVEATPNLGEASLAAYHLAQTWVIEHRPPSD